MASDTSGTPTPAKVEKLATQEARLTRTALLGIFGTKAAPSALVLLPQGKTQIVGVGDNIGKGVVVAIGTDQIVLARNGTHHILRLPRG
ncbi:type II secretion system protein N [Sulfitobacter sp.]|jgi:Tfp pilus assembly protein PilP|uniref:type II secretion system protein N n=1 Tax=Sulfitobacter sp. TaxID=1903071 RepID=UPI003001CAFA